MKSSLLLFLTISIVGICARKYSHDDPKGTYKGLSKKDTVKLQGPILLNRRYERMERKLAKVRTKKSNLQKDYTRFPLNHKVVSDVPSSPYFNSAEPQEEPKIRVKKVLPEFAHPFQRQKRSANSKKSNKDKETTVKSEIKHKRTKTSKKDDGNDENADKGGVAEKKTGDEAKAERRGRKTHRNKKNKRKSKRSRSGRNERGEHRQKSKKGKRVHSRKSNADEGARRLIAAKDSLIENYPYAVSIQKEGEHWCAGAILNPRLVITTANCVWKSNRISRLKIRAGSRHTDHGGQVVRIAEVMKHPAWSIRKNPDRDVALLLTDTFIKFSHSCHAVDLPNRVMMPVFEDAWVVSWGAERRDGVFIAGQAMTLQVYHARILNRDRCNNVTMRYGVIVTDNFICLEQVGRRAPCTRDTGAPAVSDGVLWGMASWGIRKLCGTERFPAVFSYVASQDNMDFILNATHYLMSEQRVHPLLDRYDPN